MSSTAPSSPTSGRGKSGRAARAARQRNEEDEVSTRLAVLARTSVSRRNEAALVGDFYRLLCFCADAGDWRGALRAYRTMAEKRLQPTFPQTFTALLRAAKNAHPQPASGVCIPLIEEIEDNGYTVPRELYHLAMDVCCTGGHACSCSGGSTRRGLEASSCGPTAASPSACMRARSLHGVDTRRRAAMKRSGWRIICLVMAGPHFRKMRGWGGASFQKDSGGLT